MKTNAIFISLTHLCLGALISGALSIASANTIPVFSTGGGSTTDGFADPHWTYKNRSGQIGPALVAANPGVDFADASSCCSLGIAWLANTTTSAWVVDTIASSHSGGNPLVFTQVFSMADLNPIGASITLAWGVADGGDLYFNGVPRALQEGVNISHWMGLTTLTITSGFLPGNNKLWVSLSNNDNNFEAVRVEILSATANPLVPEPFSMSLAGLGLGLIVCFRRRLSRNSAGAGTSR